MVGQMANRNDEGVETDGARKKLERLGVFPFGNIAVTAFGLPAVYDILTNVNEFFEENRQYKRKLKR